MLSNIFWSASYRTRQAWPSSCSLPPTEEGEQFCARWEPGWPPWKLLQVSDPVILSRMLIPALETKRRLEGWTILGTVSALPDKPPSSPLLHAVNFLQHYEAPIKCLILGSWSQTTWTTTAAGVSLAHASHTQDAKTVFSRRAFSSNYCGQWQSQHLVQLKLRVEDRSWPCASGRWQIARP